MKLGQTSAVYFISQIAASVTGFLVIVYVAREVGADVLGIYYLVISLVAWLTLPSTVGISGALTKRLSEGEDRPEYLLASGLMMAATLIFTIVVILLFGTRINDYVGHEVVPFLITLVAVGTTFQYVDSVLSGEHLVHISGLLDPLQTVGRGIVQVVAVFLGYGVAGILFGQIIGVAIGALIGLLFIQTTLKRPNKSHFQNLTSFAKYSWLGQISSRAFNRLDVIILGFFVSSGLIGIYSVSWNIASVLGIFASSLSATLFPELSKLSSEDKVEDVSDLVQVSLSYAGLFHIPGLIGAIVIGGRILQIYGEEFSQGRYILIILVFAYLLQSYNQQIVNSLNSIDRPDLAFRSNGVLLSANIILNITLIFLFGWIGAAVATTLSILASLIVGYRYLTQQITLDMPLLMIGKEWFAGLIMGGLVYFGLHLYRQKVSSPNNILIVLILVTSGAIIYFSILYYISHRFRTTIKDNLSGHIIS